MQKDKGIAFGLRQIETRQFATFGDGKCDIDLLNEQLEFSFGTSYENRIIGCTFLYSLIVGELPFVKIEVACHFNIEEQSWKQLVDSKKTQLVLPKKFAQHLANVTVGTSRGILHTKTEGTAFHQYPIALINLENIFQEDAIIDLSK